jgi:hypothetical protein
MRMFGSRVRLDRHLLARARRAADLTGYASVEEFVVHAVEKELARLEQSEPEDEIKRRLKGLGYLS